MAEEEPKGLDKLDRQETVITFKCPNCEQYKPISEMVTVTRFFPMLLVCRECEKAMR
jgi:transcription elongation factor Elf1